MKHDCRYYIDQICVKFENVYKSYIKIIANIHLVEN